MSNETPMEDCLNQEIFKLSEKIESAEIKPNDRRILNRNRSTKVTKLTTSSGKIIPLKGKSRRTTLKKQPSKLQAFTSSLEPVDFIFYKGVYYQLNDIVSTTDEDGDIYYAKIKKLIQNELFDKFALLTWLLPFPHCDLDAPFDSQKFFDGPTDENPHRLEFFQLVGHTAQINQFSLPHDGNGYISVKN